MPVTFWQYEGKPSPARTRMVNLWWSFLSIVLSWSPGHVCTSQGDRFYGPEKERGYHVPPHQEPPLKHHPSGVFAPHDRWNFLDAVQKAYAIPPVVVLVRGERFPSLKIQVLPMTFHFSEFSRCVRFLRASYLFPQCRATLRGVHQYDVTRLDVPFFSAFLATHRFAFLITFGRGGGGSLRWFLWPSY